MFDQSWRRDHPWFAAFILSVITFAIGLGAVVVAFVTGGGDKTAATSEPTATSTAAANSTATPTEAAGDLLTYSGDAPDGLDDTQLIPAAPGQPADIEFVAGAADGVLVSVEVLATDVGVGVTTVSAEDAVRLAHGDVGNWSELGGRDMPVRLATVGATGAASPAAETVPFNTYDEVRDALIPGSGIVVLVPIDQVRSPMATIAVDEVDPVKGDAVPATWPFQERVAVDGLTERGISAAPAIAEEVAWQPPTAVRVVGTGDVIPVRCSLAAIERTGDWGAPFRGPVGQFLAAADLALGSWDTSLQDFSEPYRCVDTVNLTTPTASVEMLQVAGFDDVNIATNHVFDCGEVGYCGSDAFLSTLDVLAKAGIKAVGGGRNLDEAQAPLTWEVNGITFGALGFDDVAAMDLGATADSPGTSPLDDSYDDERALGGAAFYAPPENLELERYKSLIADLKTKVDFVIVQLNSGYEDTHDPSPRSIKAARAAIDAGADLVLGNQGHHVQAAEPRGDSFIIYAMGNFVYDQVRLPGHTQGVMTEAVFWPDRLATVHLIPVVIKEQYRPEFAEPAEGQVILGDISTAAQTLLQ